MLTFFLLPILFLMLLIFSIKYKVRISLLNVNRIGHLALNTEVTLRNFISKETKMGKNFKERLFLVAPELPYHNASNSQLIKMFARHKNVYQSWFFYRLISVWHQFFLKTPFFFSTSHSMDGKEFKLLNKNPPSISFNPDEVKQGESFLNEIGIGTNKYVCIFQRDSNYLHKKENKSQYQRSCRDSDIDSLIPSIKCLIKKGFFVIRIGSEAKHQVSFQDDRFIDYSFSKYVSEFNDIYLIANSSFLVGSTSGICDVAMVFDVPRLVINSIPFGHSTIGKNSMFIPKKITKESALMSYFDKDIKSLIDNFSCDFVKEKGYEYLDNTDEEILAAVQDFLEYLSCNGRLESDYLIQMNKYYDDYLRGTLYESVLVPLCPSWFYKNLKLYYANE